MIIFEKDFVFDFGLLQWFVFAKCFMSSSGEVRVRILVAETEDLVFLGGGCGWVEGELILDFPSYLFSSLRNETMSDAHQISISTWHIAIYWFSIWRRILLSLLKRVEGSAPFQNIRNVACLLRFKKKFIYLKTSSYCSLSSTSEW